MARPTDGNEPSEPADHQDHPDLVGIAGEMRAEWRAEQEAATDDAAAYWRHTRGLEDWLRDRMHAGDRVAVDVAARSFVGRIEEVGPDMLALRCAPGRVEIHVGAGIPIAFSIAEHATTGGTRAALSRGFRDVLLARDGQADLTVGTLPHPEGVVGALSVGRDYVTIATRAGNESIVPIDQVAWVVATRT